MPSNNQTPVTSSLPAEVAAATSMQPDLSKAKPRGRRREAGEDEAVAAMGVATGDETVAAAEQSAELSAAAEAAKDGQATPSGEAVSAESGPTSAPLPDVPAAVAAPTSPSNLGDDLLREALPPAQLRPAPRPIVTDVAAPTPEVDEQPWYTETSVLIGAGVVGVAGLASLAGSKSPAPAPAPSTPDYYTFRVLPMAGKMTGVSVTVVDTQGHRQLIDAKDMTVIADTGELRFKVTQFGSLAARAPLKIEIRDANGSDKNFDDENNPTVGYDTDLGSTVLSAWVSRAPDGSNDTTQVSASPKSLTVTPLSTVAARYIDQLMAAQPALFADAATADQTITNVHKAVAGLFATLGSIDVVEGVRPVAVNADSGTPNAYGKALAVLSKMASNTATLGVENVIDYLTQHLQPSAGNAANPVLSGAAQTALDDTRASYFASAEVSSAITAGLASVKVLARANAQSTLGEQVSGAADAPVIAYTSLSDGLTLAINPASTARAGAVYTLRFRPSDASDGSKDYTATYTVPDSYVAGQTLTFTLPVFAASSLVSYVQDAGGRTLLPASRAADAISSYSLTIEPGPGMKPDFVRAPVTVQIDNAPVAIGSQPSTAGATDYHVGETILVKVVLPNKVSWSKVLGGVEDTSTNAPRLKLAIGNQNVEATLVDPAAANRSNVLLFQYKVTRELALDGDITVKPGALVAPGGAGSILDISGGNLSGAFSSLVDTTLVATRQGVDAVAPTAPTLTLQAASDSGVAGDAVTLFDQLTFDVSGEPLSRVELTDQNGRVVGSVKLDAGGVGAVQTSKLANTDTAGTVYTLTATAFDAAGNVSGPSNPVSMRIDTVAPTRPVAALAPGDDTGVSDHDGVTATNLPTVRVLGESGAKVVVFLDANGDGKLGAGDVIYGTGMLARPAEGVNVSDLTLASGQGYLDIALATSEHPLAEGIYALKAVLTDAAANESAVLDLAPIQVMRPTLSQPSLALAAPSANRTYDQPGDKIHVDVTFDRAVHYMAAEGAAAGTLPTLMLRLGATETRTAVYVGGLGTPTLQFEYTVLAGDNSAGVSIDAQALLLSGGRLKDLAGNDVPIDAPAVSAGSPPHLIDTRAPDALATATLSAASDTGTPGDGRTSDAQPSFTVIGEGGATVLLFNDPEGTDDYHGKTVLGRVQLGDAGGSGQVTGTLTLDAPLANGVYTTLKVVQIDAAGNASTPKVVTGSSAIAALTIATDQPGLLTGLDFDATMDRRSVNGEGLALRDWFTYIATPTFNFSGGTDGNTAILFRDIDGDGRFDPSKRDIKLGESVIHDTPTLQAHSVTVADASALSAGVYSDIRVIQASTTGVLAAEASAPAHELRISPNTPSALSIDLAAGQTSGHAASLTFQVGALSYIAGARIVVFDDRNGNQSYDEGVDQRLGSPNGDLATFVNGNRALVLDAPLEGSYQDLRAYQVFAGKQGPSSAISGLPEGGLVLDRTGPKLSISSDVFVLGPNGATDLTFTFDEEPIGFNLTDLARSDAGGHAILGSLSAITSVTSAGVTTWQAKAQLSADATGVTQFTLDATAGLYTDRWGNANQAVHFQLDGVPDQTPPVITITADGAGNGQPRTLTFTASEMVTGFELADVSVNGGDAVGKLSAFKAVDGNPLAWTALFTPAPSIVADTTIRVRNAAVLDTSFNPSAPAALALKVDTAVAPTLTLPTAWQATDAVLRVNEDTRLPVLATGASSGATALSVADADAAGSPSALDRVELSVGNGTLRLDASGGATLVANDSSTRVTVSGSTAQINQALATLSYLGKTDFNGDDTLLVTAYDRSNKTVTTELHLRVDPVNDAPVLSLPASLGGPYVAGTSAAIGGIHITDVDSASVTAVLGVRHGLLTADAGDSGATVTPSTAADGSSSVRIVGSVAQLNQVLGQLSYTGDGDYRALNPTDTTETLSISLTDAEGATATGTMGYAVGQRTVVAPVLTLAQALKDKGITTAEDQASSLLGTGQISVSDADPDGSASALSAVRLSIDSGTLKVAPTAGVTTVSTSTVAGPVLTLSGNAAAINRALATLSYADVANAHGEHVLTVTAIDGGGLEATATVDVHVTSVGDAPVVRLPAAPTDLIVELAHTLPGIVVSDVDVGDGALASVTVSVLHGALHVTADASAVTATVTGQDTGSLSLQGTQAQIQALLDTLSYTADRSVLPRPTAEKGSDVLTVTASDNDPTTTDPSVNLALTVLVPNRDYTGGVAVSGSARVGETLGVADTLADPDGIVASSRLFTWLRDGVAIGPASTSRSYELTDADLQHHISVRAAYTDLRGKAYTVDSTATAGVESNQKLALASNLKFADDRVALATQARLILSHHGSGYDDYILDVNGDGAIDAADRSAYASGLNAAQAMALVGGKTATLLSQADWAAVTALPADWQAGNPSPMPFWTSTAGDAGSHYVQGVGLTAAQATDTTQAGWLAFRVMA